jgi:hypothetical protein
MPDAARGHKASMISACHLQQECTAPDVFVISKAVAACILDTEAVSELLPLYDSEIIQTNKLLPPSENIDKSESLISGRKEYNY